MRKFRRREGETEKPDNGEGHAMDEQNSGCMASSPALVALRSRLEMSARGKSVAETCSPLLARRCIEIYWLARQHSRNLTTEVTKILILLPCLKVTKITTENLGEDT
jgi:hypothetical protein